MENSNEYDGCGYFSILEIRKKGRILEDFLRKNRAEAISMSIFEYDEELHSRTLVEEGKEEGREEERIRIIENMLANHQTPEVISSMTGQSVEYICKLQKEMRH